MAQRRCAKLSCVRAARKLSPMGNGAFIVRNVQVNPGDEISVEASFLRPNGRVDRTQRTGLAVVINGVTNVTPDLVLPSEVSNRPPVANVQSVITDQDVPKTITLTGSDPDGDPISFIIVSNPFDLLMAEAG